MNNLPVAIDVHQVSKDFILPHQRTHSIKSGFTNLLKKHTKNKTIEHQHALRDINFQVKQGEFFGIVGRNGSGKSTLLKIIAQIYQPTKGSVQVNGRLVPFIELGVGFNPELTGRENVFLSASLMGFSRDEINAMYENIVEFSELEKFMDQKLKNYSSGMQVRLAFSIATRARGDILLVDEVLAVGDADFQRKCYDYFRELKRLKKTVIFVSHDMGAVQQYCDRAIFIEKSQIVDEGSPAVIASQYNKMFIEQAIENDKKKKSKVSISGEERWGDGDAKFTRVTAKLNKNRSKVIIEAELKALKDIEKPILGFSIKNQQFEQLVGTNTIRKNISVLALKTGEKRTVSWEVPNIFNEGVFYVDSTIAHDEASSVSDRWPDAASFQVYREEKNPYKVYSPDIIFRGSEG